MGLVRNCFFQEWDSENTRFAEHMSVCRNKTFTSGVVTLSRLVCFTSPSLEMSEYAIHRMGHRNDDTCIFLSVSSLQFSWLLCEKWERGLKRLWTTTMPLRAYSGFLFFAWTKFSYCDGTCLLRNYPRMCTRLRHIEDDRICFFIKLIFLKKKADFGEDIYWKVILRNRSLSFLTWN